MRPFNIFVFLFHSVTAGLALAFVVLLLNPDYLAGVRRYFGDGPAQGTTAARGGVSSYAEAVTAAAPAVVNLYTTRYVEQALNPLLKDPLFRRFFGEQLPAPSVRTELSLGSGVIIDPQGYLLTNHHVVAGADVIAVALQDGRTAAGELIGTDPETDLAVIRIQLSGLPVLAPGNSDDLRVGDVVLAIGNPFGVGQTVTQGIVSATGRNRVGINIFENFIQTDAAINPGNSGGALVNFAGELIGINTAIISESGGAQGIGFAIPVNMAREVMRDILENGVVVRGWLGMEAYNLPPGLAEAEGLEGGALVKAVLLNGPADDAGVMPNDIVTAIGEIPIRDAWQGLEVISGLKPGAVTTLSILRQGKRLTLEATVSQRPHLQ